MIDLWTERNRSVHDKTNTQEQQFALQKLKDKVKHLMNQQDKCRPSDRFLFPDNSDQFLDTSQASTLTRWLVTSARAIKNSIIQASKEASANTKHIQTWFPIVRKSLMHNPVLRRPDHLRHDPYSKKKRHKPDRSSQTNRIDKYFFSLRNPS